MTTKEISKQQNSLGKIHFEIQNKGDEIYFDYKSKSKKLDLYQRKLDDMYKDFYDGDPIPKMEIKNLIKQIRKV